MKGKLKKTLLGVAAVAFTAACVSSLASFNAKASGTEGEYFTMKNGASVRTSTDHSGIRFSFTVSEEQEAKLSGYDVVYGMLITQKDVASSTEIYNKGAAIFTDANSGYTFDVEEREAKKLLVKIEGDTLVDGTDEDAGKKVFNAALTDISQENFTETYVGVGYIKATNTDGEVSYYFEAPNNNERTITYVAEMAIANEDPKAVGNEVVENYVNGGYANLGLTVADTEAEAGTETNPYVVASDSVHTALTNAATNSLIYGEGKHIALKPEVDCANLLAETDRAYTYMWTNDNYGDYDITNDTDGIYELENFNSPSTKAAAYSGALKAAGVDTGKRTVMNPTASWEEAVTDESGETRYGVVSMNSIDTPTISNYGATYLLMSTYRNRNYATTIKSHAQNVYDYVSMWIYIEKPQDSELEKVTVQSDALNVTELELGKWVEYKVHLPLFCAKNYSPYQIFSNNNGESQATRSVLMIPGEVDYKVYVDSIAYVKNYAEVMDLGLKISDTTNNYATMTVSLKENVSLNPTNVFYYARGLKDNTQVANVVKVSGTNALPANGKTVSWDEEQGKAECTFALDTSKTFDALWIYARFEIDGKVYITHCIYDYADGALTLRTTE